MKYKDFKMLSNDDMKQIVGGNPPDDGGGRCLISACTLVVGGTTYNGNCRPLISGGTVSTCYCNTSYGEYINPLSNCSA